MVNFPILYKAQTHQYPTCDMLSFLQIFHLSSKCFVPYVELALKSLSKLCHFCGHKVENDTVSASDKGATKCFSFENYASKKKGPQRSTHFRSCSATRRQKRKRGEENPFSLINIGVIAHPIHVEWHDKFLHRRCLYSFMLIRTREVYCVQRMST